MKVQQLIEDRGGAFVNVFHEQVGKYNRQYVVFECENGHLNEKRVDTMTGRGKTGTTWCDQCQNNTLGDAQQLAKRRGLKFLSDKYTNSKALYDWQCPEGHIWKAKYSNIHTGKGCPHCLRIPYQQVLDLAESKGGVCLTSEEAFVNTAKTKIKWQCHEGHVWLTTYSSVRSGSWCAKCQETVCERTCRKILEYIYREKFPKKRPSWLTSSFGGRMELDGYCEKLRLAFEYNGKQHCSYTPYWHKTKERFARCQQRDTEKQELCDQNDVCLITVPYTVNYEDLYTYVLAQCPDPPKGAPETADYKVFRTGSLNKSKLEMVSDYVTEYFGGQLLSTQYVNNTTKLDFQCKDGHIFQQTWTGIISGTFCKRCTYAPIRETMTQRVNKFAEEHNMTVIGEYKVAKTKLHWQCNACGYIIPRSWDSMRKYTGTHC